MKNILHAMRVSLSAIAFLFLIPMAGCSAGNIAEPPAIGAEVPDFELKDLNGATHTLKQYRGKVVLLEMCSQHCPYSRGADPQLDALAQAYKDKEVVVIGIDSHHSTPVEEIKKYAEDAGKSYAILKDEKNAYADLLGAKVTPEIFVVDKEGKLVYHGAFDNRTTPEAKGDQAYAENAVKAALEGKAADPAQVKGWGCSIKRQ